MNKFEKLAAAMRDQVEHPEQDPNEALKKAGRRGGKKTAPTQSPPLDYLRKWEKRQEEREERYPITLESEEEK